MLANRVFRLALGALLALAAAGCAAVREKNVKSASLEDLARVSPADRATADRVIADAIARCVTVRPSASTIGSGAIIAPDGWILTAEHVIRRQKAVDVILADGTTHRATVIAESLGNDYALLKIDAKGLPAFKLASRRPALGERVIAVGTPVKWVAPNASTGVVIYPKVRIPGEDGAYYYEALFHSAPIYPGDSGGPLVDMRGELIGIHGGFASENASVAPAWVEIAKRLPNRGQLAGFDLASLEDEATWPIEWEGVKPRDFAESAEWTVRSVEETLVAVYAPHDAAGIHDLLERTRSRYVSERAKDPRRDDELVRAMLADIFKEIEARYRKPTVAVATAPQAQPSRRPRRRSAGDRAGARRGEGDHGRGRRGRGGRRVPARRDRRVSGHPEPRRRARGA